VGEPFDHGVTWRFLRGYWDGLDGTLSGTWRITKVRLVTVSFNKEDFATRLASDRVSECTTEDLPQSNRTR
jgi:broad specificity phosphatase PhoE